MTNNGEMLQFKKKVLKMTSNTEIISSFNFLNLKRVVYIKELKPHTPYTVSSAYRTVTRYGDAVVLKLEDKILYLPKRFNALSDDVIQRLCDCSFSITKTPYTDDPDNTLCKLELKQILPLESFYSPYVT